MPEGSSIPLRGYRLQPYREKIPGNTEVMKCVNYFIAFDALSPEEKAEISGVDPHGFTYEFSADEWKLWRDAGAQRGLSVGVAWGLGDSDPLAKGQAIGKVAAVEGCARSLLDAESAWDQPDDAAKVDIMCGAIRETAPRSTLVNQGWHVPTAHPNYPVVTFAKWCNAFAEMRYYNESGFVTQYGRARVQICEGWFDQSWGDVERNKLGPQRLVLAHQPTWQGYRWDDVTADGINALLKYDNGPGNIWCEWWPDASFWLMVRCIQALHAQGYHGPAAVWMFQKDHPPLVIDGKCGPKTMAALGVTP